MKIYKRFLSFLCAACMIMAMSVPAFAAAPAVDDDFPYDSMTFNADDIFEFSTTAERPYYRIAIHNTTAQNMTMKVFTKTDGLETKIYATTIAPGKWNPAMCKYAPSTDFVIRLSMPNSVTPSGTIKVRLSAHDMLSRGLVADFSEVTTTTDQQALLQQMWEMTPTEYTDVTQATTALNGSFLLRKTNLDGTNGVACGQFIADRESVLFNITRATGVSHFYIRLYAGEIGNDDVPVTTWSSNDIYTVGLPVATSGLSVGETYHFKVSSPDAPVKGVTATYEIAAF